MFLYSATSSGVGNVATVAGRDAFPTRGVIYVSLYNTHIEYIHIYYVYLEYTHIIYI